MSRRQWIRLGKSPGLGLISELPAWGGYYQGGKIVNCDTRTAADGIIGMLRDRGLEAERCDRPESPRWSAGTGWLVGTGFYKSRRWTVW